MNSYKDKSLASLKFFLKTMGLLPTAHRLKMFLLKPVNRYRSERAFLRFKQQCGNILQHRLNGTVHAQKIALVSSVHFPEVVVELGLIKALELAGFKPVVLMQHKKWLLPKYYNLGAIEEVRLWSEFVDPPDFAAAEVVVEQFQSVEQLLTFEYEGTRVGRHAVSTALRILKVGSLDFHSLEDRRMLVKRVAAGMAYAKAAQRILQRFHPELVVLVDKGYTPTGELLDHCVGKNIDVISWGFHKANALMLKRFTIENRDQHVSSLSPESWNFVRRIEWTDSHREQLRRDMYRKYVNNGSYGLNTTEFNKCFLSKQDICQRLGLDPEKKTAFIFPHVSWDATLFWGKSIFRDYEEWFIETVRAACANDRVNWVVKIHPAHVSKALRESHRGEPAEVIALRKHIGKLPSHIFMIPADTHISTFSLLGLMDYCLTVRGTIGIEAAMLGIPVLTAGQGPYERRGFTIDSESRTQYLQRLSRIQEIPRLSAEQRGLAERFAFGYFILRTVPLTTVTLRFHKSVQNYLAELKVNVRTKEELHSAPDLRAIAQWVNDPSKPKDFLMPLA